MSDHDLTVSATTPSRLRARLQASLQHARAEDLAGRMRRGDATLWAPPGTPEVADRLGWLTIAQRMRAQLAPIRALAAELEAEGTTDLVLLGMGGSSLAPEVIRRTSWMGAGLPAGPARVAVLDSTSPGAVRAVDGSIDAQRTLFVVSSKSGGTIEPLSMFAHFWSMVPDGRRFVAITDEGSGLERLAAERGFRAVFHGDPEIGGRYSALSAFGIVPAALMGLDVEPLLDGAAAAWETPIAIDGRPAETPAWLWLGCALAAFAQEGAGKLTFIVPPSLDGLGLWLEQLFAESTGKQGRGILPVAQEPLLGPRDYGDDRVFVLLDDVREPDRDAAAAARALAQAGHPLIEIPTGGPADLGRIFMLSELTVAAAGFALQINPFDQPNVQEAKDATNRVLEAAADGDAPQAPAEATDEELAALLGDAAPPSYVAVMGYAAPSAEVDEAVAQLRRALMEALKVTTTFGYGPRFLHSTGQFHKGGPPEGRFLQLVAETEPDVEIPGQPYTFGTLIRAQADGDLATLRAHGLPAARVSLRGEPAAAIRQLTGRIEEHALSPDGRPPG